MYPQRDLTRFHSHKEAIKRSIAHHRNACATAAVRIIEPLKWIDCVQSSWRQLSPIARFAVVPLGLLATQAVFPRMKILRALVRWGPFVFGAVRTIRSAGKSGTPH